jgi:hypothetical protein
LAEPAQHLLGTCPVRDPEIVFPERKVGVLLLRRVAARVRDVVQHSADDHHDGDPRERCDPPSSART